jgi:membrane protein implicated in regulation of membrane protease activity
MPILQRGKPMSRTDWLCIVIFILGFSLFLVGANLPLWGGTAASVPQATLIGYAGVYMSIGAIALYLVIYIYKELHRKKCPQNP